MEDKSPFPPPPAEKPPAKFDAKDPRNWVLLAILAVTLYRWIFEGGPPPVLPAASAVQQVPSGPTMIFIGTPPPAGAVSATKAP